MSMKKTPDISGLQFGRLTALSHAEKDRTGQTRWLFRCECGTEKFIDAYNVRHGLTVSCGCLQREVTGKRAAQMNRTHGKSRTPDWYRWWNMILRCHNKNNKYFKNYGGRGITVCDRWRGPDGFQNYMADMGPRPSDKHSLDRVDNDAGYCPENCRWATASVQLRNTRRNCVVEFNGESMTIADWSIRLGINNSTLYHRWANGDRGDRLLRPTQSQGRRNHISPIFVQ